MPPYALLFSLLATSATPERPRPYDAQHYRLELRLSNDGAFENTLHLTLSPTKLLREVQLDSHGLDIQQVTLDGAEVPFVLQEDASQRTGVLTLKPKAALAPKKAVTFHLSYRGKATTEVQEGFFRVTEPGDDERLPSFFTDLQSDGARVLFPCNDRPDDKATTEVLAIVDERYQVLSNGRQVQEELFSEQGQRFRRVHWKQEQPHAPYLVAVAVGQFQPVEVAVDVPAKLWVKPGTGDRAFVGTDVTAHAFRYQQDFVGVKYPWAGFNQVVVPRLTWGGMENTSLLFMRESSLVLADEHHLDGRRQISGRVAHELAHQWFGDYVTYKSLADLWLNEGFATYMGWKTEDAYYDNDMVDVARVSQLIDGYFRAEDGPHSHPLVSRDPSARQSFDVTSYTKGAQLLWMLEKWVGEARFQKGIKAYLEKYALGNATSEDFFAAFMKATGTEKELKGFRDTWLHQRGYPVVTPELSWSGDTLTVTIRQKPNHRDVKRPFVFKLPVVFHREGTPSYAREEVILVDKAVVTARFQLPAAPQWVNWNKDHGALVRLAAPAVREQDWARAARSDPDPTWRAVAAYHLLGPVLSRDAAELSPLSDTATEALRAVITRDPSPYVRAMVLSWMAGSKWKRLPETFAPDVLEVVRRPVGLPEDALGLVRVRRGALMALGKFDLEEGRQHLLEHVMKPTVDLNHFAAYAEGVARLGDAAALSTLRATVASARSRGEAYYRPAATALGSAPTPEVVPLLSELFAQSAGDSALAMGVIYSLADNEVVRSSPEFAAFVKTFVLTNASFGDYVKTSALKLLGGVGTAAARDALAEVARSSDSAHLQASARKMLGSN